MIYYFLKKLNNKKCGENKTDVVTGLIEQQDKQMLRFHNIPKEPDFEEYFHTFLTDLEIPKAVTGINKK